MIPNLVAIIILFKPSLENINHLLSLQNVLNKIYVYDNTEDNFTFNEQFQEYANIYYVCDGKNMGIPSRLNQGCKLALEEGFEWVLLLDQDTIFNQQSLLLYLNTSFEINKKFPNTMFCAYNVEENLNLNNKSNQYIEVNKIITSTTCMPLLIYNKVGNFDEQLFLDFTDFDYSIRANSLSIKQFFIKNIDVIHPIGNLVYKSSIKTLFLLKKKKVIHSPIRCYYIIRNYFYLKNKFKKNNIIYNKDILSGVLSFMLRNLFYGRDLFTYLHYIFKGYLDFKKNKFGKIK